MKVLTLRQCPECLGLGKSPNENMNQLNPSVSLSEPRIICSVCKGAKVLEEWMDARTFINTYMDEKIKPQ